MHMCSPNSFGEKDKTFRNWENNAIAWGLNYKAWLGKF